jgi:hypothetical protein
MNKAAIDCKNNIDEKCKELWDLLLPFIKRLVSEKKLLRKAKKEHHDDIIQELITTIMVLFDTKFNAYAGSNFYHWIKGVELYVRLHWYRKHYKSTDAKYHSNIEGDQYSKRPNDKDKDVEEAKHESKSIMRGKSHLPDHLRELHPAQIAITMVRIVFKEGLISKRAMDIAEEYIVKGKSYEEIAESLGTTNEAARRHYSNVRIAISEYAETHDIDIEVNNELQRMS